MHILYRTNVLLLYLCEIGDKSFNKKEILILKNLNLCA